MTKIACFAFLTAVCSCQLFGQTVDNPLRIGGSVKPPVLIKQVDPDYHRPIFGKPKEGTVLVNLVVDEAGRPTHLKIVRSLDKKFDKSALNAVSQYRFKPATREDKPVAVELNVDISFRIQ